MPIRVYRQGHVGSSSAWRLQTATQNTEGKSEMNDTEFRRTYDTLTANLSQHNETLLTISLPMICNADSDAVEEFIVNHWKQPVDNSNFEQVGHEFKRWFGERYPEEYVNSNFALNIPPSDKPKRRFNPNWPSARKDAESGAHAARTASYRKRFAEVTGYASPAKLVKAIEAGLVTIDRQR